MEDKNCNIFINDCISNKKTYLIKPIIDDKYSEETEYEAYTKNAKIFCGAEVCRKIYGTYGFVEIKGFKKLLIPDDFYKEKWGEANFKENNNWNDYPKIYNLLKEYDFLN